MFKILHFPNIDDTIFHSCLGVLGFVLKEKRNKDDYSFVPSKFIQPLSKKSKIDLIKYLIDLEYIRKVERNESNLERRMELRLAGQNYKKKPNIYYLLPKLLTLSVEDLNNTKVEKTVATNLHHLNLQSFNHWVHNYRRISIHVPNDKIWEVAISSFYFSRRIQPHKPLSMYMYNIKVEANKYGYHRFRNYDITDMGIESHFGGRVSNIFTICDPILRYYTSLKNAVEIGIKYSEGVIMADQLLKKFGANNFSDYFLNPGVAYKEKLEKAIRKGKKKLPSPPSVKLFTLPDDDYTTQIKSLLDAATNSLEHPPPKHIFGEVSTSSHYGYYRLDIVNALFGWRHNVFFHKAFPKVWSDILYQIKAGNTFYFETFVSGINPFILKKDWRIQIQRNGKYIHPNGEEIYRRGQIYYKVVALVWILREMEIMRAIWTKLKRFGIRCIPINDKVLVEGRFEEAVKKITLDTWREYLDPKILIFSEVIKRH